MITMTLDSTAEFAPILWVMIAGLIGSAALLATIALSEWIKLRRRQNPLWLVWRWWPVGAGAHHPASRPRHAGPFLGGVQPTASHSR